MRNISTWWQVDKKWELKWESEIPFRLNSIKTEKTAGVECFECYLEKIFLNKIDVISEVGLWVETEKKKYSRDSRNWNVQNKKTSVFKSYV